MSCIASPEFLIFALILLLIPIAILQFILKCKTRWKLLLITLSITIELFIIFNQSKICSFTNVHLGCSLFFSIAIMIIVPIIIYSIIRFVYHQDNKFEERNKYP